MSILSMPLAHIVATFEIEGEIYQVDHFQIGFRQPIDFKGKPQHEVTGGQLTVTLEQIVSPNLNEWMRNSTARKNGIILFRTQDTKIVYRVKFENAYCINFNQHMNDKGGLEVVLVIAPEIVYMNDMEHNNFWPK